MNEVVGWMEIELSGNELQNIEKKCEIKLTVQLKLINVNV